MKKVLSIPLILLILFSGISVKFATHYCHGSVAATKVSLTGEPATCGMESQSVNTPFYNSYSKHCCYDVISAYSICNNYLSSSHIVIYPFQKISCSIDIPTVYIDNQAIASIITNEIIKPPGYNSPNSVDRPLLCVFRI
jgi:hypothetical protein